MGQDVDTVFIRKRKRIDVTFEEIDAKLYLCCRRAVTLEHPTNGTPNHIHLLVISMCKLHIWIGIIKIDTSIIERKSVFKIS